MKPFVDTFPRTLRPFRVGRALAVVICLTGFAAVASADSMDATGSASAPSTLCGPFDQPYQLAQADVPTSPTTPTTPTTPSAPTAPSDGPGSIVDLPEAPANPDTATPDESEALLALPKNAAGAIPTDFELGPGAQISQSFFSPVLCATLAKVTGPAGATLDQLVTVVPEGSTVVPNDIYLSAAAAVQSVSNRREGPVRTGGDVHASIQLAQNEAGGATGTGAQKRPDPYVSLQYGLAISGVREARGLSAGAGVTIALLDSAPDPEHRELSTALARLDAEATDRVPEPGVHGTLMAGVMSAVEGNGFGIMGLAPEASLVSIPVCTPSGSAGGSCTIFDILQGLDRAWDAESDLVNLSLSGPANSLLERGVARLEALGVVVIAAAGNEGADRKRYPAAYPSVVGVGAIDRHGRLHPTSNRGDWVEMLAPGVEILSTIPGNAFAFGSGTSLAAAHVTGELAVLTAAIGDARLARAELFRAAADSESKERRLPRICDVFRRLDLVCDVDAKDSADTTRDAFASALDPMAPARR